MMSLDKKKKATVSRTRSMAHARSIQNLHHKEIGSTISVLLSTIGYRFRQLLWSDGAVRTQERSL